jgi:hypothetical protein
MHTCKNPSTKPGKMQMRRGEGTHKFLGMTVGHEVEETFG